jgi:hypothetical protein
MEIMVIARYHGNSFEIDSTKAGNPDGFFHDSALLSDTHPA